MKRAKPEQRDSKQRQEEAEVSIRVVNPMASVDIHDDEDKDPGADADAEAPSKITLSSSGPLESPRSPALRNWDAEASDNDASLVNFYEVLYGLAERKCGSIMPIENYVCQQVKVRLGLRMPSLRRRVLQYPLYINS